MPEALYLCKNTSIQLANSVFLQCITRRCPRFFPRTAALSEPPVPIASGSTRHHPADVMENVLTAALMKRNASKRWHLFSVQPMYELNIQCYESWGSAGVTLSRIVPTSRQSL